MAQITVRVQPKSSRNLIQESDDGFKVWLTAPPTDGQANAALCELIAKQVGVPKSSVSIVRGHASRSKVVNVSGLSESEVRMRITEDADV
jgi:uncharacterized protein (TIGR00251 family)